MTYFHLRIKLYIVFSLYQFYYLIKKLKEPNQMYVDFINLYINKSHMSGHSRSPRRSRSPRPRPRSPSIFRQMTPSPPRSPSPSMIESPALEVTPATKFKKSSDKLLPY